MCEATIGALHCQRPDTHPEHRGHVYHATTDDLDSPTQPHADREQGDE